MTDNAMGFHIDYFHKNSRKNSHFLGDCDYFRNIQGALQRKWNVEIWAWHSDCSDGGTGTNEVSYFYIFAIEKEFYMHNSGYNRSIPVFGLKKRIRELGRRSIF
ncbi:hypothetical protein RhiirA5_377735 [Rhizophagus irregularis]|uniref:Uncharacterized protein n=1 Tax=Rhizophagus irregularis TaxID=588596 RepID=A0A2I1EWP3_9GLOM|nr:hypothetical protein RhiirA5_377735 [Rhizophagus irregularis]PKC62704.1 hypothetical protein RhiirA1_521132 [Rhizophagus irregularis]PKY26539.1 hypothetical protein RhiirB3_389627 [Rhizophagus irregularis]